ncbi:ABC transporter ATP-binding protein [Clostridium transplantifaecale]|uniref:ABC transporter ATP-binding protein n=1 Tax=Clostridium transplantifaecale TaxID=2479838 RepID=UPI000F630126|nr:ABC transporter ATP-binding protein [Clostridium transplantifaecale]
MEGKKEKLLEVSGLSTFFKTDDGTVRAVDGVSFSVNRGESLGIVGESGSGKSVTSLSIMRLTGGGIISGRVIYQGKDLLKLSEKKMQDIRGDKITMIFQDPMTSLDPVYTIGFQLRESIMRHKKLDKAAANELAEKMLVHVGISNAKARLKAYPHQLSGGMRQRVMIAMALVCEPELLIADEPTTALDVTIQAQILELIQKLKKESGMALLLITHDLGVIAEMCDRVMVMYCGQIVEVAPVKELFKIPFHEYTKALLRSIPYIDKDVKRLQAIPGSVPPATNFPEGCRFYERCDARQERCRQTLTMKELEHGHFTTCVAAQEKYMRGGGENSRDKRQ